YSSGFYPYSGYDDYPYSATSSDPWWDGDGDNVAPSSLGDTTAVTPPVTGYQSFYSPAAEADDTARVTVNVPPGAAVRFNGTPTTSTGPAWLFSSPPLSP